MMTYTYDEVREATLSWFDGDQLACDVWAGKYALQNEMGEYIERTPSDMFDRLAQEFARIEERYPNAMSFDEVRSLLAGFDPLTGKECFGDVVAQGSPMSGIGNPYKLQSLSNCFVIPSAYDSYSGIMRTDEEQISIMKRRGGVGHDISTLRPKGMRTANAAGTTDGIGVFMERFSNSCREVAQGGRRGALMLTIDVRHPQIETFIDVKRDQAKVTGANISIRLNDEFMHAVQNDESFTLRWPVDVPIAEAKVSKAVNARVLWNKIVSAAHDNAEPGLLFWDNVLKNGPADAYDQFKSVSTNPCLTGDTMIAVADGRGYVTIKELADAGLDVPVYACDDKGKITIRTMRNPRLTGQKMPVYKVIIEGGHAFRATGNHQFPLITNQIKRVDQLLCGDQLKISKRVQRSLVEFAPQIRSKNRAQYICLENNCGKSTEHKLIWEEKNGKIPSGHVIHHIDFNSKNNVIENLRCMTKKDHDELHTQNMFGDRNPMRRAQNEWSDEKWQNYHDNLSLATSGLKNGNALNASNVELFEHIKSLTLKLGRRISKCEWASYAKENELPVFFTNFRCEGKDLFVEAAREVGIDDALIDIDPRMARRWIEAEEQGYACRVREGCLEVQRKCEYCDSVFWNEYSRREVSFCSSSCALIKNNKGVIRAQINSNRAQKDALLKCQQQLDVFTRLRFEFGKEPLQREWYEECLKSGVSGRLGTKFGMSWHELKEKASNHNHRVISVEFDGYEDVYNGTVDEFHNFYFGGWEIENNERLQVLTLNCGEIPLSPHDSCRLMLLNLHRFVQNPYLSNASFDFERFAAVARKAQRLMDDLVDLEIECVGRIIAKIESDPEPERIKRNEIELWRNILLEGATGRRTGLGVTGLGDAMAACGVTYGSSESVEWVESVYRCLAHNAYRSTVTMAQERGAFPAYDAAVEKGHPFIERILRIDPELRADYERFGRRNVALTTTAPAGSVSLLTQTTSGCEPVYRLSYTRRKKINPNDSSAHVDFIDAQGDKWQHFTVHHQGLERWMKVTGEIDITKSPYFGAASDEIPWQKRVEIQAAAQRWICHSISSTINLPKETTVETVGEIYMAGWINECKGLTIYRDGCRDGVLIEHNSHQQTHRESNDFIIESDAPKRPRSLDCDVHHVTIRGEKFVVLVGLLEGKPYEVFAGLSKNIEIPKKFKCGKLIKNGKNEDGISTYNLELPVGDGEKLVVNDVIEQFDNKNYGAFSRIISTALRHGTPVRFLAEQLRKDKHSDITSFGAVIARVLSKNYLEDKAIVMGEKCDVCGSSNVKHENGCSSCNDCGSSKCS